MDEYIRCGHEIDWRWKSVGQDGAFCRECMRVYPVLIAEPEQDAEDSLDFFDVLSQHRQGRMSITEQIYCTCGWDSSSEYDDEYIEHLNEVLITAHVDWLNSDSEA